MGIGNHMLRNQLPHSLCCLGPGLHGGLHGPNVPQQPDRNQPASDPVHRRKLHGCGFDCRIGGFDDADEAQGFDET